jgi:hypothetical protein
VIAFIFWDYHTGAGIEISILEISVRFNPLAPWSIWSGHANWHNFEQNLVEHASARRTIVNS